MIPRCVLHLYMILLLFQRGHELLLVVCHFILVFWCHVFIRFLFMQCHLISLCCHHFLGHCLTDYILLYVPMGGGDSRTDSQTRCPIQWAMTPLDIHICWVHSYSIHVWRFRCDFHSISAYSTFEIPFPILILLLIHSFEYCCWCGPFPRAPQC